MKKSNGLKCFKLCIITLLLLAFIGCATKEYKEDVENASKSGLILENQAADLLQKLSDLDDKYEEIEKLSGVTDAFGLLNSGKINDLKGEIETLWEDLKKDAREHKEKIPSLSKNFDKLENKTKQVGKFLETLGGTEVALASPHIPSLPVGIKKDPSLDKNLDKAVTESLVIIFEKQEQLDRMSGIIEKSIIPLIPQMNQSIARLVIPIEGSFDVNIDAPLPAEAKEIIIRHLDGIRRFDHKTFENLKNAIDEMSAISFIRDLIRLGENAEFLTEHFIPEVYIHTIGNEKQNTFHIKMEINLSDAVIGPLMDGDVFGVELPRGFSLANSINIVKSKGTSVFITGNVAGSNSIAIFVLKTKGDGQDSVSIQIDQDVNIEPGVPILGELKFWNTRQSEDIVTRIITIPSSRES